MVRIHAWPDAPAVGPGSIQAPVPASLAISAAIAIAGTAAIVPSAPAGAGLGIGAFVLALLLAAQGWGRLASLATRSATPPPIETCIGMAWIAHLVALPLMLGGASFAWTAWLVPLGLIGLCRPGSAPPRPTVAAALVLAALAGFAGLWSLDTTGRYAALATEGIFKPWSDSFIHAGTIAEFGDPRAVGRGTSGLADVAATTYHAGSHALAGLAVRVTGLSPAEAIPAFWLPMGILLMMLGAASLGNALAGPTGAAGVCIGLIALPDASTYGLRQGLLSFHWMLEVAPGSAYAMAAALCSIAMLVQWTRTRRRGDLFLSGLLLGLSFLLRIHVFAWLLVPWMATAWITLPWRSRAIRYGVPAAGALAAVPMMLAFSATEIRTVGLPDFLFRYIETLHVGQAPTAYDGLYARLVESAGRYGAAPVGVLLAVVGIGGAWAVVFPVAAAAAARRRALVASDLLPFAMIAWAIAMSLLAPTPFHGDYTDLRHRAFVLLYVVLIAWTVRFGLMSLPRLDRPVVAAWLACASLLAAAAWLPDSKSSKMQWGRSFSHLRIEPGLIESGRWMRERSGPGDTFLLSGLDAGEAWFDEATVLLGSSGMPAWISRPGVMRASGPPRSEVVDARLDLARRLHAEPDATRAFERLRSERIAFYVARTTSMPAWDPAGSNTAFASGTYRIWQVPR